MTKLERIEHLIRLHEEQGKKLDLLKCHLLIEAGLWSWELETRTKNIGIPEKRKRDVLWINANILQRQRDPNARLAEKEISRLLVAHASEISENSSDT